MAPGHPVRANAASRSGKTYSSASGHPLHNLGEQALCAETDGGVETEMLFQLADVSCPLISVSQICDHVNRVIFGRGGGVILNLDTGMELFFERQGYAEANRGWRQNHRRSQRSVPPRGQSLRGDRLLAGGELRDRARQL